MTSGIITLWNGLVAAIPSGWVLCDGNNGTPDLRNRFVIGAGGGLAPGDVGGNQNHLHAFTGDNHQHTFTTDGHLHNLPGGSAVNAGATFAASTDSKTDTGTTNNAQATGSTDNTDGRPPFYALAYIMKT